MAATPIQARLFRFGPFELDARSGELRKHGIRIKLREQPIRILRMLLENPGEAVLREDIRLELWPNNTIVEFDHGINAAIQRLREALGESAGKPRYVETVARRGYRFLGNVERIGAPRSEQKSEPGAEKEVEPQAKVVSRYRLLDKLGEGGMGVVYRAEDLKLGRCVAIKFLPMAEGEAPESVLRRFEREARAAATLNDPHICTIYGLEDFDGRPAIVMELVTGETLATRLAKGPVPVREALHIAAQVAAAMAEAQRKGVVHRDLKPGNIMLTGRTATGPTVKVLDFGLAKMERTAELAEMTVTTAGTVLGTPYYMSPEQAQGKETDSRSDIFSFGVVLFEMLTARRPFDGQNAVSVTAAILERDPPPLGDLAPPALDRLVRLCLAKDPDERWQSARDLMSELQWIAGAPAAAPAPSGSLRKMRWRWAGIVALAAFALAVAAVMLFLPRPVKPRVVRFPVFPPEGGAFGGTPAMAVSPDGQQLVLCSYWKDHYQLWLRSLDNLTLTPLAGSEGFGNFIPFWSPDSRSIAFFADGKLKRIDLGGPSGPGPAVTLSDARFGFGGTWSPEGVIVFSSFEGGLNRVPAVGGTVTLATRLDAATHEGNHVFPWFLPDGRHFLFSAIRFPLPAAHAAIRVGSLDSQDSRFLLEADSNAIFLQGRLLFVRDNTLLAQPFDARKLVTTGDAVPVAEQIEVSHFGLNMGFFWGSEAGVLTYFAGADRVFEVDFFPREGGKASVLTEPARPLADSMELSPDQRTVALAVIEQGNPDIWLYDVTQGRRTRLTFDPASEISPVWSPDGRSIAFASNRKGRFDIYRRATDQSGGDELVFEDSSDKYPTSWSPDGRFLLYNRIVDQTKGSDIWVLDMKPVRAESPVKPFPLVESPADERRARFSPDGHWVVYDASEAGPRRAVYLVPFSADGEPAGGKKRELSTTLGFSPRWRKDGREIFYIDGRRLMAIAVESRENSLQIGEERQVLGPISIQSNFDVSSDGQRFLVLQRSLQAQTRPLTVVENWTAGLRVVQK